MRKIACALAWLPAFAGMTALAEPAPNKDLAALFDREFKHAIEEHPELGTIYGIPGHDDKLTDHSPTAIGRRKGHVKEVIEELKAFDPAKLDTQDRISRDIALERAELEDREDAFYRDLPFGTDFGDGWNGVSTMNGPELSVGYLVNATRFATVADYENYLKRLSQFPASLDQLTQNLRAGIRSGWMPPHEAMVTVPKMFDDFAGADITRSPMWIPFTKFPGDIGEADRDRLAAEGRRVLATSVHPAFAKFQQFVEKEYLPATRKELASSALPGGMAYYALRVRENTTLPLDPAEIHKTGLAEVARIRGEMDKVIASTGFKGTFEEFIKYTQTDPRFFSKSSQERLMSYRDMAKRADAELPKLFATLPRLPYGVRPMEAYEGDNADHYSPGALDGSRAGFFDANVNNAEKKTWLDMESTLLHEAVPGHHLQNSRALEIEGLPQFRRTGWYVAYGEGWALYAESLGYEMGFYKDPYSHFGALENEMLRACRLVIDTGIHTMGWTRAQSIQYLGGNTGMNAGFVEAEVDRYIVMPGQALGYKIGELKIKALRAKARAALGERFDLRRFHNVILDDGALPLTILESRVDEWIAREKNRKEKKG
ncbi:MAG: DUF885 domain-containing protein [Usitatibacter sp.]